MKRAKRSLPTDFDPVYPYGNPPLNILPPFYSTDGFQEFPVTTLSLKVDNPVTFSDTGGLTLKLGGGVSLNQNGELESSTIPTTVNPPLENSNGSLSLNIGEGLQESNGALVLYKQPPFIFSSNALSIDMGNGMQLAADKLSVKLGNGLSFSTDGSLQVQTSSPLINGSSVGINLSSPFAIDSNQALSLQTESYFSTNNSLSLNVGDGLQTTNNQLSLQVSPYFGFSSGALSLSIANMMNITNNTLGVNVGDGLFVNSSNDIAVNVRAPLNYSGTTKSVTVVAGPGLTISGETLGSDIRVNAGNGLFADAQNVRVKLGAGLIFDSNGNIQVNVGSGLQIQNNAVVVASSTNTSSSIASYSASSASTPTSTSPTSGTYLYNYQIAFSWDIVETEHNYFIYTLRCTEITPQNSQSELSFTPTDQNFIRFFDYINTMQTVAHQISGSTVTHIPITVTYSNSNNQLRIIFSSRVLQNVTMSPWVASVVRYKTTITSGNMWMGAAW